MLTCAFSLKTYALPIKVEATSKCVTSSGCQVMAFPTQIDSSTNSVTVRLQEGSNR